MGPLRRRGRAARFAVTLGLAAAAHVAIASTLFCWPTSASAADKGSSTEKLIKDGKSKFEDGQYEESIEKLSAAILKQDITKDQKIEALRLLAYNYIVRNQDDSARAAAYQIFALDEDFALSKKESPRFREPFAKYKKLWIDDGKPGQPKPAEKPPAAVWLKHSPATEVPHDSAISIGGSVDDPDKRVAKVSLFYRAGSSGKFTAADVALSGSSLSAKIPSSAVKPPLVEYYLQAFDEGGIPIANRGDADTPLRVAVAGESGSVFGTWWFWTGTTAIIGGAIVGGILLSRHKNPSAPTSTVTITVGQ